MEGLKRYLIENFEQIFVLFILLSVAGITYFIPYKLAFLNFYFIPILLAAYYLGVRKALLGGVLCTLMVIIYTYYFPEAFMIQLTVLDLWMNIMTWASFLILTAAVVGQVTTRLKVEVEQVTDLNRNLEESKSRLGSPLGSQDGRTGRKAFRSVVSGWPLPAVSLRPGSRRSGLLG